MLPNARGPGSIPSWGTRSHMPQLRPGAGKQKEKNNNLSMSVHNSTISNSQKNAPGSVLGPGDQTLQKAMRRLSWRVPT